ncbi:MAG: Ig-like domain-containing protein [Candidatus Rifleibacteriota bacterium]
MALRIFVACVIGLLLFIGCGGGGGGGGSAVPVGPAIVNGEITGSIQIDSAVASMRQNEDSKGSYIASRRFIDSFIFIEEMPSYSTRADEDGNFKFENLPLGSYRIIARITSLSGRKYKIRSADVTLTNDSPNKQANLQIEEEDLADSRIRIQVKNLSEIPVGRCKVTFWGEEFTLDSSGYYVSPYMPEKAAGSLKIEPPPEKNLAESEFYLIPGSFDPDYLSVLGFTLPTRGIDNKAPVVNLMISNSPSPNSAFLRVDGQAIDPEGAPLSIEWKAEVGTFSYLTDTYADWAIPAKAASETIVFSASEIGSTFPRLTSFVQLDISVASSGAISFPGEIYVQPVNRSVAITGTATAQISGNVVARYVADTDFPEDLTLEYNWSTSRGSILSDTDGAEILWQSPALDLGETFNAKITLEVSDGVGEARTEIDVKVTAAPIVTFTKPAKADFEPGIVEFAAEAKDYLNAAIPARDFTWYLASPSEQLQFMKSGVASFSYNFPSHGSYTVALECRDSFGVIGTGTKVISIINAKPVCSILEPADGASYLANTPVTFKGQIDDYEDGAITEDAAFKWYSDIDGFLGSGTVVTVPSLSSAKHTISLIGTDSVDLVGSTTISVWYDMPARITFLPSDRDVIFEGNSIEFIASGTDSDGTTLDAAQFKWYLNNLPEIWKEGSSFTIATGTMTPGLYQVRVEGPANLGTAVSDTHNVQIGWPVASITSPASGTRFDPGDGIPFVAVPVSTGTLQFEWYSSNDPKSFGSNANENYSPANGEHIISYIATDSQGNLSSSEIRVVVERIPVITVSPADNAYVFNGHGIDFTANCTDTNGDPISGDAVRWLLNGSGWQTGDNFTAYQGTQADEIPAGSNQFTVEATGPYGTVGSRTQTINTGVQEAQINSPADNSTFTTGEEIKFQGVPDSTGSIQMEWWANYGDAASQEKIDDGASVSTSLLPDGYYNISYFGVDDTGYISSDSINISVGQFPEMAFTPADVTAFFESQDVDFNGLGTDTLDNSVIPGSRMAWYVDDAKRLASFSKYTVDQDELAVIGAGYKKVELRGYSDITNAVGREIKNIYLGVQTATITSPLNDEILPSATEYNFTGLPDSTGPITMEWWLNYGVATATYMGAGSSLNYTAPDGIHYLTYIGTDSAGIPASATIRVIVSDSPTITFTPSDGSVIFVDKPFDLVVGGPIVPSTVNWYLDGDGSPFKTGSPETVNPGEVGVGWRQIKAEGENTVGVTNEISNDIFYGHPPAEILTPASGTRYDLGTDVAFTGSTASPSITMSWFLNDVNTGVTGTNYSDVLPAGWNTISYSGVDDGGNTSTDTIMILMDDPPSMDFTPGNGSKFFAGTDVEFTGVGTGSIAAYEILDADKKWYLNAISAPDHSAVKDVTFLSADLTTGTNNLTLTGEDQYGVVGTITYSFDYGFSAPSITSPADGSEFALATNVNFAGTPDSDPPITMSWYLEYGTASEAFLGSGANISHSFATRGTKTISYLATDSAGVLKQADIQIIVNEEPTMVINNPVDGGNYFGGQSLDVSGSGTDINGDPVDAANFIWYLDGSEWKSTIANFTATKDELGTGTKSIRLEGTDDLGTTGAVTNSIQTGISNPLISSPADGSSYNLVHNISFSGNDLTGLVDMEWYCVEDAFVFGTGPAASISTFSRGLKTIHYQGTDDAGTTREGEIQITINDPPTASITAPLDSDKFFGGQTLSISGNGTDSDGSAIDSASFKWLIDGASWKSGIGNFTATIGELGTGTRNIKLEVTDDLGSTGSVTHVVQTGISNPSISSPADGSSYNLVHNISFSGNDLTGLVDMEWYCVEDAFVFGTGPAASISTFSRGLKTINYRGTDDAGTAREGEIQITINDPPTASITAPLDSDKFFGGQTLNIAGNGEDSGGGAVDSANFEWYLDTVPWKSGTDNFTATIADLGTGSRNIKLEITDDLGSTDNVTHSIQTGISLPVISSPASGTEFGIGSSVNFSGNDLTGLVDMEWYCVEDAFAFGAGPSASITTFTRGLKTIHYRGTDDSGTTREGIIQILVNDDPSVSIATPTNGGQYFGGQTLTFSGNATDSANASIPPSNLSWYIDTNLLTTGTDSYIATIGDLGTGTIEIKLEAEDNFGEVGQALCNITTGITHPEIISPASGSIHNIGSINFIGNSDPLSSIPLEWYADPGGLMGTGSDINYSPSRGITRITYVGTDSKGLVAEDFIDILVDDPPDVSIKYPIDGGMYFGGQDILFEGLATDSGNVSISPASFTWYQGGTGLRTGVDTFDATVADLPTGTYNISLEVEDEYGVNNSVSRTMTTGMELPEITSPASGTRFDSDANVSFTGSNDLTGNMEWYWVEGATVIGSGSSDSYIFGVANRGWQTIEYRGTDSQGTMRSDRIMVLIDTPPTFTLDPFVVSPVKYADGPEYMSPGNHIPVYLASPGAPLTFSVEAQNEVGTIIPPDRLHWYEGATNIQNAATFTLNFEDPGSFTYTVVCEDEFAQTATTTITFWTWEPETYSIFSNPNGGPTTLNLPATIVNSDNTTAFAIDEGNSRIVKLTRMNTGLTTDGDLTEIATETAVASHTHNFIDLSVDGTTLVSLGNNAGADYRIQSWNTGDLGSLGVIDYPYDHGTGDEEFDNPLGLNIDANAIYISDSGNNMVKKIDRDNGEFYSDNESVTTPVGINYVDSTNIFVAEQANNRLLKLNSSLNTVVWNSGTVNNAHYIVQGPSGNLYITDPTAGDPKVHVVAPDGTLLYSFGNVGTTPHMGEFTEPWGITIMEDDLYIVDKSGNCIHRLRFTDW